MPPRVRSGLVAVVVAAVGLLGACAQPGGTPSSMESAIVIEPLPTQAASSSEPEPTATEESETTSNPGFASPTQFDQGKAVALGTILIDSSTLNGSTVYSAVSGQIMALDATTASMRWTQDFAAPLSGSQWSCWTLATGASSLYVVGASFDRNFAQPMLVQASAYDLESGNQLWTAKLPTSSAGRSTECSYVLSVAITETQYGALFSKVELNDDGQYTSMSSTMLDSQSGTVVWKASGFVMGTTGRYGVMADSQQVRAVDLANGTPAGAFKATLDTSGEPATVQAVGQYGDNLVIMSAKASGDGQTSAMTTTSYVMSAKSGAAVGAPVTVAEPTVLGCPRLSGEVALCSSESGAWFGVNVRTGETAWQYAPQPTGGLLTWVASMGNHFYVPDGEGESILSADSGVGVATLPVMIIMVSRMGAVTTDVQGNYTWMPAVG